MANHLMMRAFNLIFLSFLFLTAAVAQPANRWEYITSDDDNTGYYLDLTTVIRPEPGVVVFWVKEVKSSGYEYRKRFKMWCGNRKYMRIDEPNYRMQDVAPDTTTEAFLYRLDHSRR